MSRISKAGSGLCGIRKLAFCLAAGIFLAAPIAARDAHSVGEWLCDHIFTGPGITLAFASDGFFGLNLTSAKRASQSITGSWRLSPDGIQLTLFNCQDRTLKLTVGQSAIHGNFLNTGAIALHPSSIAGASFTITGFLEKNKASGIITDAASGKSFAIDYPAEAAPEKFATAEVVISSGKARATEILTHSAPVPRFYEKPVARDDIKVFWQEVVGRYWLLPEMPGIARGALRFDAPGKLSATGGTGKFDITGPGLRLEGSYQLEPGKLTLTAPSASIANLKLMGADTLAQFIPGVFQWRLLPRGLELSGTTRLLLLDNQS